MMLCRCSSRDAAAAVAARLQARAGPRQWENGELLEQLGREICLLCRTARKLDGVQALPGALREGIAHEALAYEPGARALRVSRCGRLARRRRLKAAEARQEKADCWAFADPPFSAASACKRHVGLGPCLG